uniref:tRNA synthetases class I catalytic domain-containing protein n=2 Tax=Phaeomonas parva TaxID=124430 RepID=A0A7S1U0K5_9STRA|mmetsp:Transcript_26406/g.82325  ORF Transcript_26406/g.82325 Transcript_26406/m.82325 type:complete len:280 (+) Transcript_26406:162-1001(+)
MEAVQDGASEGGGISDGGAAGEKRSPKDFALWKARKDADGEVSWDAPWGAGRPGWHIECSAMAKRYLGPTLDLHAGGVDLVFPHHENEVAQSEAANGAPFCNCWVHNGFVNIDGEKMSKSLGNFRTLRDVCKDAAALRGFRLFVVTSQYRSPLNFNLESLKAATNAVKRLDKLRSALRRRPRPRRARGRGGARGAGRVPRRHGRRPQHAARLRGALQARQGRRGRAQGGAQGGEGAGRGAGGRRTVRHGGDGSGLRLLLRAGGAVDGEAEAGRGGGCIS